MEKSQDVKRTQMLAYVIKKHRKFEWVRYDMYSEENIYQEVPMLIFRFSLNNQEMYTRIEKCLTSYQGKLKWILYKGFYTKKNYVIEPYKSYCARRYNCENEIHIPLKDCFKEYMKVCEMAIEDIPMLCNHIDKHLD